ncbi:MAG: hypothetical protein Q4D85_13740 [Corynebacterium sp.]|uniref:hypothetical protein n=1 Tax=Corynebacterium sp. TaxID=1720 RepID=UPI0026DD39CA|nr:hypothetical protein [Corynebacterium sp.]MDO5099797.1 hypothetical protein [Corynebacterium sp.]
MEVTNQYVPFSQRMGLTERFEPTRDLFPALNSHLHSWLLAQSRNMYTHYQQIERRLRFPVGAIGEIINAYGENLNTHGNSELIWDIIDAFLVHGADRYSLSAILDSFEHEYTVHPTERRLIQRLDKTTLEGYSSATTPEDESSDHLNVAWNAVYSRNPDYSKAWEYATKAVEAALRPIVAPNDSKATLGKLIGQISSTPNQWTISIAKRDLAGKEISPIDLFISTLRIVNYSPDRHGGSNAEAVTKDHAILVLHQATAIVNWLRAGCLQKI